MLHIFLHFLIPLLVSLIFKKNWWKAYLVMMLTMAVDLDHLLATPIYDPNRCSIHFHPLHNLWLLPIYFAACFWKKTRYIGFGLIIHMGLDSIDCQVTNGVWYQNADIIINQYAQLHRSKNHPIGSDLQTMS